MGDHDGATVFCVEIAHGRQSHSRSTKTRDARSVEQWPGKNAQSDQQDLIGKMETNWQEKPSLGKEALLEAEAHLRRLVIGQCDEG